MTEPLISVCIPVFNGETFIAQTIQSVLKQTCPDYELLIVDNHSTDDTLKIIHSFQDARIRVVENDANIGFEGNWNKCLDLAKGHFIKMLPADDLIYPECLAKQAEILRDDKHQDVSIVSCGRYIIGAADQTLMIRRFNSRTVKITGPRAIRRIILSGTNPIGEPGAVLFRRELIAKTGKFDTRIFYTVDLDLWCRLLLFGSLYAMADVLCGFRVSPQSASVHTARRQQQDFRAFIQKIRSDERYRVPVWAAWVGYVRAGLNASLRRLFYLLYSKGKNRTI